MSDEAPAPAPMARPAHGVPSWVVRLFVAHGLAYVAALPWSVAFVPIVIWRRATALEALGDDDVAIARSILDGLTWPLLVVFLLAHLFGIPWALSGARSQRGRRFLLGATALCAILGLALSAYGWPRLVRHESPMPDFLAPWLGAG